MGLTLAGLGKNTRLQFWYEEIQEKENSGMTVKDWCQYRGCSLANFYIHQKQVRQDIDIKIKSSGRANPVCSLAHFKNGKYII